MLNGTSQVSNSIIKVKSANATLNLYLNSKQISREIFSIDLSQKGYHWLNSKI